MIEESASQANIMTTSREPVSNDLEIPRTISNRRSTKRMKNSEILKQQLSNEDEISDEYEKIEPAISKVLVPNNRVPRRIEDISTQMQKKEENQIHEYLRLATLIPSDEGSLEYDAKAGRWQRTIIQNSSKKTRGQHCV
jgi:hypothetical protein